jgi:hypothetical protein
VARTDDTAVVGRYLALGLELGRHLDGLVDAYYGPADIQAEVAALPPRSVRSVAIDLRALLGDLDAGAGEIEPRRRRWLRSQVAGLRVVAMRLAGEPLRYSDEVEACYGVRPRAVSEDELADAHRMLDEALPGNGPLGERFVAWRENHAIPVDRLEAVVDSLADDLRARTVQLFGLPDEETIDWQLVSDQPWSGFNYYLGGLRSRVAINTDLPVLSTSIAQLVAHEAYPGHHTEHVRKEAGLVRQRGQMEETIALIGTPQCLVAEGLADLGVEVLLGADADRVVADHLRPLGIVYDADTVSRTREASEVLSRVRGNAALALHEDGVDPDEVIDHMARWALLPRARAAKAVEFLTDPTWRAYISCYIEGLPLCRAFVGDEPARFEQLITEQLTPADLRAGAAEMANRLVVPVAVPAPVTIVEPAPVVAPEPEPEPVVVLDPEPAPEPAPEPVAPRPRRERPLVAANRRTADETPVPVRQHHVVPEPEPAPEPPATKTAGARKGPPRLAMHANRRRR